MRISATPAKPAVAKRKTRGNSHPPFAGESEIYRVPPAQSLWWGVSRFLAEAATIVVCATLLVFFLNRPLNLRERFVTMLPDVVARFFTEESAGPDPAAVENVRSKVAGEIKAFGPNPANPAGRVTAFGLGSTQAEVRAVQGAPTTESAQVWRYGASEVYFASGRVVGWNSASGSPLRTR